ncbi:MAG TPA: single-stranded DNA-binding protein [Cytophagaceae bacterium]|jgi:single-strand DNA-binding protein
MAGVNKVILVGHLGKDPEIRALESGRKVANFTLATTESYKDKNGERVDSTEWHNISFWGPIADVIEKYLKKGSQIYVEGKIRTRSYEDKDKVKKYVTEIVGNTMTMLGKPGDGSGNSNTSSRNSDGNSNIDTLSPSLVSDDDSDDLPF